MIRQPLCMLLTLALLFCAGGASCPWFPRQVGPPIPQVLPATATLDQVVAAVNENSARVQSAVATQATLSVPGVIPLRADLAFQRPRNFRLRAGTALGGDELDVGSNDLLFWRWLRREQPPAVFFCRHDQWATSNCRQFLPVEPQWLLDALGLPTFAADEQHQGPFPVGAGRLEVRSMLRGPDGNRTRIAIIDATRGLVLEQHLYGMQGELLASAVTKNHVRDPVVGANLPRRLELQWPSAQLRLAIDVVDWQVNVITPQHADLWTKPQRTDAPDVDLADPRLQFSPPVAVPVPRTPAVSNNAPTAYGRPPGTAMNPAAGGNWRSYGAEAPPPVTARAPAWDLQPDR